MGNYLNIGNAGFQAIRKGLYVDKSEMIAFVNNLCTIYRRSQGNANEYE